MRHIFMAAALWVLMITTFGLTVYGGQAERTPVYQEEGQAAVEEGLEQLDLDGIEEFLNRQSGENGLGLSFKELIKALMAGDFMGVLKQMGSAVKVALFEEVENSGHLMAQIMILGIIGAVFANFSTVFSSSQISETAFFATYLLLFTFLAASFFSSISIAGNVLSQVLDFMRTLLPAYFLAAAFAGGSVTSLALYEVTLFSITAVQWVFYTLLLPLVKVYVLLVLAGHIAKEDILSKLTELLKKIIQWTTKTLVGLILGFHLIQGMVLPYVDSMKNTALSRFAQIIPGIGPGADAVSHMIVGSGVLIKNTMGAAAVVILLVTAAIPVLKLTAMMLLYECAAAVLQPVCDKRIVSCISDVAQGHRMLLQLVLSALLLFIVSIAVVCVATNVTYYAG